MAESAPAAFCSYCREDSDFALRLAEDLKAAGASVWLDQLDIVPGQRWDRAVEDALANCPRMLVILSPASVNSTNVMDEVSFALEERKTVIPVICKDCTIPFRLRRVQYVDFRQDYARGLKELLKTLASARKVEQSAPATSAVLSQHQTDVTDVDEREDEAERRKAAEERRQAEQARVNQQRKQAADQERLEQESRRAAEQAWLEDEARKTAERTRLEEERERAAKQAKLEQERKQAADRARQEEERRKAQEQVLRKRDRKEPEEGNRQADLERQIVAAGQQRQEAGQGTQRFLSRGSHIFSGLPVWSKILVASCGIVIVALVFYWASARQPSGERKAVIPEPFIDQHPSLFVAFFSVYFVGLWLLVGAVISFVGGWFSLSKLYRTRIPFNGAKWGRQSGQMRWLVKYNNVLTLGANQEDLYLACMFLFRFMHPPLVIPWSEIKIRRSKGWLFEYVTFTLGHELTIPLRIRARLAGRLRNAAGASWPVEEMGAA